MIFNLALSDFMLCEGQMYYCVEEEKGCITLFKVPDSNIIFRNVYYFPPMPIMSEEISEEDYRQAMDARDMNIITFKQSYTPNAIRLIGYERESYAKLKLELTDENGI